MRRRYFFYGTLRSGFWNNHYINRQRGPNLAVTTDLFRLFIGDHGIPFLVKDPTGYPIIGEVWELDIATQDLIYRLEQGYDHGDFDVVLANGEKVQATLFYANSLESSVYGTKNDIEETSGDYAKNRRSREP